MILIFSLFVLTWCAEQLDQFNDSVNTVRESEEYFNGRVKANDELCDMNINFIIDCAVKLQDSDFDTSKYLVNPREFT